MSTPARVVAFVGVLAVLFVGGLGAGRVVSTSSTDGHHGSVHQRHGSGDGMDMSDEGAGHVPGGLMSTQDGYTFRLLHDRFGPGRRTISFVIEGPDGRPVTAYDTTHEKQLHLIAVRRDFTGFQHVHPVRAADGTWSVPLRLSAGTWRLFADVDPSGGPPLVLGQDLEVPGTFTPAAESGVRRVARVGAYEVRVTGDLTSGRHSMLTMRVSEDGRPVTDLQPYLGAYGHLVALREGDLAYLHVHPAEGEPGPEIEFGTEVPSAGVYHLYLDFKHDGVVRTATFELAASR